MHKLYMYIAERDVTKLINWSLLQFYWEKRINLFFLIVPDFFLLGGGGVT